ncbi:hypothetical protein C8N46_102496 [Kordia periserrulae]|uniref:Uncharacterized protein n=1 Tax=Kordia periserrulae TaxID=701523 RepID=A0A2T6C483_9FLAO|nr:hypothetical protein [Kordia periserrulae]PTX63093.1 hypothetical protein C8N46_102496 [Kordia periserrulae]
MKKIAGFILLSVGGYILISLVMHFFGVAETVTETATVTVENSESYELGVTIGKILIGCIAVAALYFGYMLLKKANEEVKKDAAKKMPKKK